MKYELETIPIWEAYKADVNCPLCFLEKKAEETYVKFFLGSSVMNPETRIQVNDAGFCGRHYSMLFAAGENRHGLGLVTHTHLPELKNQIKTSMPALQKNGSKIRRSDIEAFCTFLEKKEQECMICSRLQQTLNRFTFTIVYLWQTDPDFKTALEKSKGVCLHHTAPLMRMAAETLSKKECTIFISDLWASIEKYLEELESSVYEFSQHFDYRFSGKSWGKEKDALIRAINTITGASI